MIRGIWLSHFGFAMHWRSVSMFWEDKDNRKYRHCRIGRIELKQPAE